MPPSASGSTASRHDATRSGSVSRWKRSATTTLPADATNACVARVVGAAPNWITSSGRWVGAQALPSKACPAVRHASGRRAPEIGSATIGHPSISDQTWSIPESCTGHPPTTIAPRAPDTRPASRSISSGSRAASGRERPLVPFARSAAGIATSSDRRERFLERAVEMHRSRRVGGHRLERLARGLAPPRLLSLGRGHGEIDRRSHVLPEQAGLHDRLVRSGAAHPRRTIRGEEHERHPRLRCLDDGREELGRRRPARGRDDHRLGLHLREAEGEEGARSLVQVDVHPHTGIAREGDRERRRT